MMEAQTRDPAGSHVVACMRQRTRKTWRVGACLHTVPGVEWGSRLLHAKCLPFFLAVAYDGSSATLVDAGWVQRQRLGPYDATMYELDIGACLDVRGRRRGVGE